jgi:hypothetical protein
VHDHACLGSRKAILPEADANDANDEPQVKNQISVLGSVVDLVPGGAFSEPEDVDRKVEEECAKRSDDADDGSDIVSP